MSAAADPAASGSALAALAAHADPAAGRAELDSRTLLAGRREVAIRHGGTVYRLLLTAQNKLILMK